MIEIIREEDWEHTSEKKALPKDIKQIGRPDIGDRIYVEDHVYQFLHPYDSQDEKTAYVLLGRFENYAGRQCTFVEAAIRLEEMNFEGELPLWNDQTWAYIYKKLKKEYESMVIVGWAMDIKGQLPNMTVRIEGMHQNNFGGVHQVLFLMDTLENEETFYGSRSGHLYRREGFYIYYDKHIPDQLNSTMQQLKEEQEKIIPYRDEVDSGEAVSFMKENLQDEEYPFAGENPHGVIDSFIEERLQNEGFPLMNEGLQGGPVFRNDTGNYKTAQAAGESGDENIAASGNGQENEERPLFEDDLKFGESESLGEEFRSDDDSVRVGTYRKKIMEKEDKQKTPSYAYSLLLAVIVCVLGITAFQNYQKMNTLEATLAQMKGGQPAAADQKTEQGDVNIETVSGNIKKQNEDQASDEKKDKEAKQEPEREGTEKQEEDQSQTAEDTKPEEDVKPEQDTRPVQEPEKEETGQQQDQAAAKTDPQTNEAKPSETAKTDQTEKKDKPVSAETNTYLDQGYYIVQKGENLAGICRKIYQTTAVMDKLCELNEIEDKDSIFAGQYLKLPK